MCMLFIGYSVSLSESPCVFGACVNLYMFVMVCPCPLVPLSYYIIIIIIIIIIYILEEDGRRRPERPKQAKLEKSKNAKIEKYRKK